MSDSKRAGESESLSDSTGKASEQTESEEEIWISACVQAWCLSQLTDFVLITSIVNSQRRKKEGEWDPQRDVYSLGCALLYPTLPISAGAMLHSLIPLLYGLLTGRILSRLSLSVDLPEGLDNEKIIVKLGHTAVKAILFYFQLMFFKWEQELFLTHVLSAHFKVVILLSHSWFVFFSMEVRLNTTANTPWVVTLSEIQYKNN